MILFVGENINSLGGGGVATRSNLLRLKEEYPDAIIDTYNVMYEAKTFREKGLSLVFGTPRPFELIKLVLRSSYNLVWIDRSTYVWLTLLFPFKRECGWRVYLHNEEIKYHTDLALLTKSPAAWLRVLFLISYTWLCRMPHVDIYSINPCDIWRYSSLKIWLPRFGSNLSSCSTPVNLVEHSYYLIIGSMFPPNMDGLKWLIENVSDAVEEQFVVIGKGLSTSSLSLRASSNIHVIGEVEDLRPYIEASIATIAPIRYGSGLKIKIAESIYFGKHCLATSLAAEPFKLILKDEFSDYISTFDSAESLIDIINAKGFSMALPKGRYFVG